MTINKTNIKSLPYILMVIMFLLLNIVFTLAYVKTHETFLLVIYLMDIGAIISYNPWTKIIITENSIIETGFFQKKEIFFHQIKQLSIIATRRKSKYVTLSEMDNPFNIYQICVLKEKLPSIPSDYIEISKKDYIQFDYRPEVYEKLKNAIR